MIKILKTVRKEKGLCLIVTELDAKAANIDRDYEKDVIDCLLEEHLIKLSDNVDNDTVIKHLKEFLIESVFTHYIDMVGILNYIYTMRNVIKVAKKHPSHSKFLFVMEFKNYIDDESGGDNQPDSDEDEKLISTSIKFDLLKKNDLEFAEKVIFTTLTAMHGNDIVSLKPKKVTVFLKEQDVSEKPEEFVHIVMTFDGQTK